MNVKTQENTKLVYLFGVFFSLLMLFTLVFEWALPRMGWLRSLNNSWSDLRGNSPLYAAAIFSSSDNPEQFRFSFGRHINKPADPRILIAAIDNHTLNNLGYPFPRKHYGELIEKLNKFGAKVIVMDVFTMDPDKSRPESDASYVRAVGKARNVISSMGYDRWNKTCQVPIKGLPEASRYVAIPNMDKVVGSDNMVRNVYLFDPDATYSDFAALKTPCGGDDCANISLPGLSAAAYAIYNGEKLSSVWARYSSEQPYRINYRHPFTHRIHPGWSKDLTEMSVYPWISVLDIIQEKLSPEEKQLLKGSVVMVGSTAIGAYDHYPSPFIPNLPGVEVHANVLDNMLNGDFLRSIDGFLVALIILLCVWMPIFLRKHSIPVISSVVGATILVALLFDYYLIYNLYSTIFANILISLLVPFMFITVHKALMEGREKKWIKNTFGQYLSPKVVDLITKDPSKLSLGGEKRDMTAFFLDLAGFTTMSEKLSPEELTAMLVEYLSAFTDVILKYDGTVDKYIGDCVVAFWNAPLDQADHRKLGVMAAIDCQKEMARLNESLTRFTIKPKCRVGVNSGPMVVGNMGSRSRLSYTVMGDSVNMASRMEGANKYFHSKIMTSEHTFGEIKDYFDYRYLGSIRVVGKAIPTKVYEPFALKGEAAPEVKTMLGHYAAGIEKFYKGDYSGSLPDFKAALAAMPGDGPAQFYVENAEKFAKEPPKNWDQSFNLTEKG